MTFLTGGHPDVVGFVTVVQSADGDTIEPYLTFELSWQPVDVSNAVLAFEVDGELTTVRAS